MKLAILALFAAPVFAAPPTGIPAGHSNEWNAGFKASQSSALTEMLHGLDANTASPLDIRDKRCIAAIVNVGNRNQELDDRVTRPGLFVPRWAAITGAAVFVALMGLVAIKRK